MKILYAADGSPPARAAFELVTKAARREGVEIKVLNVVTPDILTPEPLETFTRRLDDARSFVAETRAEIQTRGFIAEGSVRSGLPAPVIVEASNQPTSLVLMGAGRTTRLEEALLGSTSRQVLHQAPCSVLLAHEFPEHPGKVKVLFGSDGSADSQRAIVMARDLLDPELAAVTVLSVARVPVAAASPYGIADGGAYEQMEQDALGQARGGAELAGERFEDAGFDVEVFVKAGSPAVDLASKAKAEGFDLVVVGSRGMGRLGRVLLGSVSDRVTRAVPATLVGR